MPGYRNRIAGDIETNEAFPDRETNPTDFDKLKGGRALGTKCSAQGDMHVRLNRIYKAAWAI